MKGLNTTEGTNRYRFSRKRERAEAVNVDVTHQVRGDGLLDADEAVAPESGSRGCFFQEELDRCRELNTTSPFKRFYYRIWPLVQSLPELLHHKSLILEDMLGMLADAKVYALAGDVLLQLLSVMCRDLQGEMFPHFDAVMEVLVKLLVSQEDSPEKAGQLFRSIGYLLKYLSRPLLEAPDSLRPYYAPLIGHRVGYIRRYAAEAFAGLLRKLKAKAQKKLAKELLAALARAGRKDASAEYVAVDLFRQHVDLTDAERDTVDGCAQLFFFMIRGVKGRVHSKGPALLRVLLHGSLATKDDVPEKGQEGTPWSLAGANQRAWCFEVVKQVVDLLKGHIRPAYCAEVWMQMQYALGVATERYKAVIVQQEGEAIMCISLHCQIQAITLLVGHMRGILLRDAGVLTVQAPLLVKALEALTAASLFQSPTTTPACRTAVTTLLSACLNGMHQQHAFVKALPKLIKGVVSTGGDNAAVGGGSSVVSCMVLVDDVQTYVHPAVVLCMQLLPFQRENGDQLSYVPVPVLRNILLPPLVAECGSESFCAHKDTCLEVLLRIIVGSRSRIEWVQAAPSVQTMEDDGEGGGGDNDLNGRSEEDYDSQSASLAYVKDRIPIDALSGQRLLAGCDSVLKEVKSKLTEGSVADLAMAAAATRCLPVVVGSVGYSENALLKVGKKALKVLDSILGSECQSGASRVLRALALESAVSLCSLLPMAVSDLRAKFEGWYALGLSWVQDYPRSMPVLRAVGVLLNALRRAMEKEGDDGVRGGDAGLLSAQASESVIHALAANFSGKNRMLRLFSARVIDAFDKLEFVSSAADGDDLADVSNEEVSSVLRGTILKGPCPVPTILKELEEVRVSVALEREHTVRLDRLEVMARSGRLPPVYVSLVAHHMMGLMYVKYSELWPQAGKVFVSLVNANEADAWGPYLHVLKTVSRGREAGGATSELTHGQGNTASASENQSESRSTSLLERNLREAVRFEAGPPETLTLKDGLPLGLLGVFGDEVVDRSLTQEMGTVPIWSVVEHDTAHASVWGLLNLAPELLQRKSKAIVPMVLTFIQCQYLAAFPDDIDVMGVNCGDHVVQALEEGSAGPDHHTVAAGEGDGGGLMSLEKRSAKRWLMTYLKIFAKCTGPKNLYKEKVLEKLYVACLVKADGNTAKVALEALLTYKHDYLLPYKEQLLAMASDATLRDELTKFDLKPEGGMVEAHHRGQLVPVITRLLFGRFLSKGMTGRSASKTPPAVRRAAILSSLGALGSEELIDFVVLMVRSFLPHYSPSESAESQLELVVQIDAESMSSVALGKQVGFLSLVVDVTKYLGFKALPYVGKLTHLVLCLLQRSDDMAVLAAAEREKVRAGDEDGEGDEGEVVEEEVVDDNKEGEEVDEDEGGKAETATAHALARDASKLRALSLQALTALLEQYHDAFDFTPLASDIWQPLSSPIRRLASSCIGATKPPTLLVMAEVLARLPCYDPLSQKPGGVSLISAVLDCLCARSSRSNDVAVGQLVVQKVFEILEHLLDREGALLIRPHFSQLVQCFSARFRHGQSRRAGKSGDALGVRELAILCKVAEYLAAETAEAVSRAKAKGPSKRKKGAADAVPALGEVSGETVSELASLLLPFLLPTKRASRESKLSVLRIFAALVPRLKEPMVHWTFLCKLLGTWRGRVGIRDPAVRDGVVCCFEAMAAHPAMAGVVEGVELLRELNAVDTSVIENVDLERVVPAVNSLSDGSRWAQLVEAAPCDVGVLVIYPAVYHCLFMLHDEGVAIRGAATAALRKLVEFCANTSPAGLAIPAKPSSDDLMNSVLLPGLRCGMLARSEAVRKGYVMVLQAVVERFRDDPRTTIPSDLSLLARDDDAEADFFHNLAHVQIHRRQRALAAIRKRIETASARVVDTEGNEPVPPFRVHTLVHYLLPLVSHPLHEVVKVAQQALVQEAQLTLGAIAGQLPWSHYHRTLRNLMQQVAASPPDTERALLGAMTSVIDAWHFDISASPPSDVDIDVEVVVAAETQPEVDSGDTEGREAQEAVQEGEVGSLPTTTEAAGEEEAGEVEDELADAADEEEGLNTIATSVTAVSQTDAARKAELLSATVWRALTGSLLGKMQSFLTREAKDKTGTKVQQLRAPVALAMVKLIRRMPEDMFVAQLNPLLLGIANTLKSRDSNVRDVSRDALAKIAADLGPQYLRHVVMELRGALKSGYQLHVLNYTLHSILVALSKDYKPPVDAPSIDVDQQLDVKALLADKELVRRPPFDLCVPELVEVMVEDMFGNLASGKDFAQGHNVKSSKIKEAKGQKALDSIELMAKMLLFRPTYTVLAPTAPDSLSTVHALVGPMLHVLADNKSHRMNSKANEALQRVQAGLAANASMQPEELLLYVHATIAPFLVPEDWLGRSADEGDSGDDSDSEDDDDPDDLLVNGIGKKRKTERENGQNDDRKGKGMKNVRSWMVTEESGLMRDRTARGVYDERKQKAWENSQVIDGAIAPKLTGNDRDLTKKRTWAKGKSLTDPEALAAVIFGLGLLKNSLGKGMSKRIAEEVDEKVRSRADMFPPLLSRCISKMPQNAVVLLALRCIGYLLRLKLPSMRREAPAMGRAILKLMVRSGPKALSGELGQGCFKALGLLFKAQVELSANKAPGAGGDDGDGQRGVGTRRAFGLDAKQLRALLLVLQESLLESENQSATVSLIAAMVDKRVVLPEMYDLMAKVGEMSITAHRTTLRGSCASVFLQFLLYFPLGEKRLVQQIQAVLDGIEYVYEEGRLAALDMTHKLLSRLPTAVLDQHAQLFFLKLTVRLVNDDSSKCRAAVAGALLILLRRVSGDMCHLLLDYCSRWFEAAAPADLVGIQEREVVRLDDAEKALLQRRRVLLRTAAQTAGCFAQARPDLLKRGSYLSDVLTALTEALPDDADSRKMVMAVEAEVGDGGGDAGGYAAGVVHPWECIYHAVVACEKLLTALPSACDALMAKTVQVNGSGQQEQNGTAQSDDDGDGDGDSSSEKDGSNRTALSGPSLDGHLMHKLSVCLLYPHAWVRLAAARAWGIYLSRRVPVTLLVNNAPAEALGRDFLLFPGTLYTLCRHSCAQLDRSTASAELQAQCVKNLVFIGQAVAQPANATLCISQQEEGENGEGGGATNGGGDDMGADDEEEAAGSDEEGEEEKQVGEEARVGLGKGDTARAGGGGGGKDPLGWLFHRMSYLARGKDESKRRAVFTWFAAMAQALDPDVLHRFLPHMLTPLQRSINDAAAASTVAKGGRETEDSTQKRTTAELAAEVMDLVESKVGSARYLEAVTRVNKAISDKKTSRKRERAVEAIVDPESAAQRKMERTEDKKQQKKRRIDRIVKKHRGVTLQRKDKPRDS